MENESRQREPPIRVLKYPGPMMYGLDVLAVQQLLLAWDVHCLPKHGADKYYNEETARAVLKLQKLVFAAEPEMWHGRVDARTWDAFFDVEKKRVCGENGLTL